MFAVEPKPQAEPWGDDNQQADDYGDDRRRERFGNNKPKYRKATARAKQKAARAARKKNR